MYVYIDRSINHCSASTLDVLKCSARHSEIQTCSMKQVCLFCEWEAWRKKDRNCLGEEMLKVQCRNFDQWSWSGLREYSKHNASHERHSSAGISDIPEWGGQSYAPVRQSPWGLANRPSEWRRKVAHHLGVQKTQRASTCELSQILPNIVVTCSSLRDRQSIHLGQNSHMARLLEPPSNGYASYALYSPTAPQSYQARNPSLPRVCTVFCLIILNCANLDALWTTLLRIFSHSVHVTHCSTLTIRWRRYVDTFYARLLQAYCLNHLFINLMSEVVGGESYNTKKTEYLRYRPETRMCLYRRWPAV